MEPDNLALDRYILASVPKREPEVCFIPTASGDDLAYINRFYAAFDNLPCRPCHLALLKREVTDVTSYILENDIIYVGGGNTNSMLSLWRETGLDQALREAWQTGTLLCGISAGAICWFEHGISDSVVSSDLRPLRCLGLLQGTACPHYDEPGRREAYHRYLQSGEASDGYGIDNGVALHFAGRKLLAAVASRKAAYAYRVFLMRDGAMETGLTPVGLV